MIRHSTPSGSDRKSTRLNSTHGYISHSIFFFKPPPPTQISPPPLPAPFPSCRGRVRAFSPRGPVLAGLHDPAQHTLWVPLDLHRLKPDGIVAAFHQPRCPGGIVGRLVGRSVQGTFDLDHKLCVRARVGGGKGG